MVNELVNAGSKTIKAIKVDEAFTQPDLLGLTFAAQLLLVELNLVCWAQLSLVELNLVCWAQLSLTELNLIC
ncbi:9898_t:CDS:2 [Gigaspora margarita]|uniref:9898_t:CDS:1 n=1 Tax=Gigaspora margarita TaxID=4874 RepID=A0ABN7VRH1_GIGMA|nr:9898_t:CDS:2 [Gigaspora margarita]